MRGGGGVSWGGGGRGSVGGKARVGFSCTARCAYGGVNWEEAGQGGGTVRVGLRFCRACGSAIIVALRWRLCTPSKRDATSGIETPCSRAWAGCGRGVEGGGWGVDGGQWVRRGCGWRWVGVGVGVEGVWKGCGLACADAAAVDSSREARPRSSQSTSHSCSPTESKAPTRVSGRMSSLAYLRVGCVSRWEWRHALDGGGSSARGWRRRAGSGYGRQWVWPARGKLGWRTCGMRRPGRGARLSADPASQRSPRDFSWAAPGFGPRAGSGVVGCRGTAGSKPTYRLELAT